MNDLYTKVIGYMGHYYTKDFEKTKKNITKKRPILESTIKQNFLKGKTDIRVFFVETGREIIITPDSSKEDILKYLGPKFIQK